MSAAANGHLFAVDLLLNRGAQIDAKDHQDKVVELLLVRGSDVNTVNKCRESAWVKAAKKDYIQIVQILWYRDDINMYLKDFYGNTPLLWAVQKKYLACWAIF